jgi:hypothetical protein
MKIRLSLLNVLALNSGKLVIQGLASFSTTPPSPESRTSNPSPTSSIYSCAMLQSTSSALVATSRIKVLGFQRSLASRNQPAATPTPPTSTHVHAYAQQTKLRSFATSSPFEPRPSQLAPPSRGWRFLNPSHAALPRLSSWGRALIQQPSALPAILPPSVPARSVQRATLCPSPLSIRKPAAPRLGVQSIYNTREQQSNVGRKLLPKKSPRRIMAQCVYVPWLIHGESAESTEWNAFLGSELGHHYCKELHA